MTKFGYHRINVGLQGCDGPLGVIFCDGSLLLGMLLGVRLTEKIEYELPTDLGTTAVIKIGLLIGIQIPVTIVCTKYDFLPFASHF